MKQKLSSIIAAGVITLAAITTVSCNRKQPSVEAGAQPTDSTLRVAAAVAPKDTLAVALCTRHSNDTSTTSALNIQFPVPNKKKAALIASIHEWISEELGGTYGDAANGNYARLLADTTAVINHYYASIEKHNADVWKDILDNMEPQHRPEMQIYDSMAVTKAHEGKDWVTMEYVNSCYMGGAHGSFIVYGQTFRKSDGRRIGWDIFRKSDDPEFGYQHLLRKGMLEYFSDGNPDFKEEDLEGELMNQASSYYIPLPQCPPLFTEEGILFLYNQYEVAAYAAGLPQFVISYKDLAPYLNATILNMLQ